MEELEFWVDVSAIVGGISGMTAVMLGLYNTYRIIRVGRRRIQVTSDIVLRPDGQEILCVEAANIGRQVDVESITLEAPDEGSSDPIDSTVAELLELPHTPLPFTLEYGRAVKAHFYPVSSSDRSVQGGWRKNVRCIPTCKDVVGGVHIGRPRKVDLLRYFDG